MQTMSLDPAAQRQEAPLGGTGRRPGHRSFGGRVLRIVVVLLLAGAAFTVIGVAVGPRLLPYKTYFVRSASMQPTIPVGALAVYRPVDATKLKAGDVIAFARPDRRGEMVSHRIVRVDEGPEGRGLITKGDANGAPDDWRVPVAGQGWRYSFRIPFLGYGVGAMGTAQGRLVALLAFGLSLSAMAFLGIWRSSPSDPSLLRPSLPLTTPTPQLASLRTYAGIIAPATPSPASDPPASQPRVEPDPPSPPAALHLVPEPVDARGDLQDYLTIISCNTSVLLRSTPKDDERRDGLNAIADAARRAAHVLDAEGGARLARDRLG